jgi:ribosomal protein S18 acetylase RimI-like enzyme
MAARGAEPVPAGRAPAAAPGEARAGARGGLRIREVDPANEGDVRTVTALHLALFAEMGPMAQLGELFVRRYCYTLLLRDGALRAAVCEVDGEPAGMVAYTAAPRAFHESAVRRHLAAVVGLAILSLLRDPVRAPRRLWTAVRLARGRGQALPPSEEREGEVLAIGVLPPFRHPGFVRRTGWRVGELLLAHAFEELRRAGVRSVRMIVDEVNAPALVFYHRLGGRFRSYPYGVKPSVEVRFDLDA